MGRSGRDPPPAVRKSRIDFEKCIQVPRRIVTVLQTLAAVASQLRSHVGIFEQICDGVGQLLAVSGRKEHSRNSWFNYLAARTEVRSHYRTSPRIRLENRLP